MVRSRLAALLALALTAAGIAACGPEEPPRPEPQEAADSLASQLGTGSLAGGVFAGPEATDELEAVLGDLAEVPRTVVAGAVLEPGDTTPATFTNTTPTPT
ncbi:MAG TPA: hypothetical protein GX743_08745, partial [Actinomycetales bacterium]|nr:hypothetical protein [Actinomycetales bacterium]